MFELLLKKTIHAVFEDAFKTLRANASMKISNLVRVFASSFHPRLKILTRCEIQNKKI
jgi:hypothetical protein